MLCFSHNCFSHAVFDDFWALFNLVYSSWQQFTTCWHEKQQIGLLLWGKCEFNWSGNCQTSPENMLGWLWSISSQQLPESAFFFVLQEIWLRFRNLSDKQLSRTNYFFIWRSIFLTLYSSYSVNKMKILRKSRSKISDTNSSLRSTWTFNARYFFLL